MKEGKGVFIYSKDELTKAEQLLYDISYSYLNDSDETVKPDTQICIDLIDKYFDEKEETNEI